MPRPDSASCKARQRSAQGGKADNSGAGRSVGAQPAVAINQRAWEKGGLLGFTAVFGEVGHIPGHKQQAGRESQQHHPCQDRVLDARRKPLGEQHCAQSCQQAQGDMRPHNHLALESHRQVDHGQPADCPAQHHQGCLPLGKIGLSGAMFPGQQNAAASTAKRNTTP